MAKEHKPPTQRKHAAAPQRARAKQPAVSSAVPTSTAATAATSTADPSTWRVSRLWAGRRINKTRALNEYRLKPEDLEGLACKAKEKYHAGFTVNAQMYKEQDIERKAWERHGGPDAFEAYLQKLRERHAKANKTTPFVQPAQYNKPAAGTVGVVQYNPPPATYDRYVGSSAVLSEIKMQMAPWLWTACNKALDGVDAADYPYNGVDGGSYSRPKDREGPMQEALRLAYKYPARGETPLPSSPAVDNLRAVLADAPRFPPDHLHGKHVDGMDMKEICSPEYNFVYEWETSYLDRVFTALMQVIHAHGTGADGWFSARWEVYDKYVECFGGLSYKRKDGVWSDISAHWLDGQYTIDGKDILFSVPSRSKSSVGREYNAMLPHKTPQDGGYVGFRRW
ncbi:hypothetical protein C8Q73DRAFT_792187 [Cubamyces lactineus]|nr:hypothetical protein C8Q73DRAFT_792187 [Cubamyces lactineus]